MTCFEQLKLYELPSVRTRPRSSRRLGRHRGNLTQILFGAKKRVVGLVLRFCFGSSMFKVSCLHLFTVFFLGSALVSWKFVLFTVLRFCFGIVSKYCLHDWLLNMIWLNCDFYWILRTSKIWWLRNLVFNTPNLNHLQKGHYGPATVPSWNRWVCYFPYRWNWHTRRLTITSHLALELLTCGGGEKKTGRPSLNRNDPPVWNCWDHPQQNLLTKRSYLIQLSTKYWFDLAYLSFF